jgi:hypothetical protein
MARPLMALERFLERLLERPAARLFATPLQPVQLQRRIERAMETERRLSADRTYVPNRYAVRLCPNDLATFAGYRDALEEDLAAAVTRRARERGYALVERAVVVLRDDPRLGHGDVAVDAAFEAVAALADPRIADESTGGGRTAVLSLSEPASGASPSLTLVVHEPGRDAREFSLTGPGRIGRAAENDLVLLDDGVSRFHGRVAPRQGAWVFEDLGSSNGSFLNGHGVTEVALGQGDELRLGSTRLTVRQEA